MPSSPVLTLPVVRALIAARAAGQPTAECSLDLLRSTTTVRIHQESWEHAGQRFPYLERCKERTIYYWSGMTFEPAARYSTSLVKLVPTDWGAPTFEIDGIKMLPTSQVSPYADAGHKVGLIHPRGKRILDTCGGLGYFAAWCREEKAGHVLSFEKNADVLWLRSVNPWSPEAGNGLTLNHGDAVEQCARLADASFEAILHDPPRISIAGELYSQTFYEELARLLQRRGRLFHYTGTPNKLTSGRDVPNEVATRLRRAGFKTQMGGDGILAVKS